LGGQYHLINFCFLELGGGGVFSILRSASSNLMPLRFSGPDFLLGIALAFCFFTVSFSSPTMPHLALIYQLILNAEKIPQSDSLPIRQPFTFNHRNKLPHAFAVGILSGVPAEGELAGILQ
jgi:hypothetical protein